MSRIRIYIFFIVGIGVLFFSFLSMPSLKVAQKELLTLLSPLIRSGSVVKKNIGGLGVHLMTLDQLDEAYRALLLENTRLQAEHNVLSGLQEENNKLRQQLGYREQSSFKLLPATVIARDNSTWWNTVKIDRGSKDGITSDMPVITDHGLIGKTSIVTPSMSVVLLVTDEGCNIAAKVEGTSEQGIASGLRAATGELQLAFLNKLANLQPGQKVYTAGVSGGIFPSGIEIGTVKSFHVRELDGQAFLEPTADLDTLENVFVIAGAK